MHHSIEKLAVRIKRQLNIPIIVGGPHPTYSPEMIFGDGIDIICQGEGELAMLELRMRSNTTGMSRRSAIST